MLYDVQEGGRCLYALALVQAVYAVGGEVGGRRWWRWVGLAAWQLQRPP